MPNITFIAPQVSRPSAYRIVLGGGTALEYSAQCVFEIQQEGQIFGISNPSSDDIKH